LDEGGLRNLRRMREWAAPMGYERLAKNLCRGVPPGLADIRKAKHRSQGPERKQAKKSGERPPTIARVAWPCCATVETGAPQAQWDEIVAQMDAEFQGGQATHWQEEGGQELASEGEPHSGETLKKKNPKPKVGRVGTILRVGGGWGGDPTTSVEFR